MMEQMQGAGKQHNPGENYNQRGKIDKFDDDQLRNVDITS